MKVNESLYTEERQKEILNLIKEKNRLTVKELSTYFNISEVTIRSDLNILSKNGNIIRTHGGAIYVEELKSELPISQRKDKQKEIKKNIGMSASGLINDGEVIFIDASTTAGEIIPFLKNKNEIIVITNSLEFAYMLAVSTTVEIIMLGGTVRRESLSVVREAVGDIIPDVKISKAFFGAWGFSLKDGLTDVNPREIKVKKRIAEKSREIIALVDSSKWGKVSYGTFIETDDIDVLITDLQAPDDMIYQLKRKGLRVIQV